MRVFSFPSLESCLVASILALAACQPSGEPESAEEPAAEEPTAASDEELIQSLVDRYTAAWNDGDAAAIAALYTADGDLVAVDGRVHEGRAELQARMSEDFESMFEGTEIMITTDSLRFLEPDIALVDGSFTITGMTGPDGAAMDPLEGLYSNVVVKEGGEWKLEAVRPMVPQPVPTEGTESEG